MNLDAIRELLARPLVWGGLLALFVIIVIVKRSGSGDASERYSENDLMALKIKSEQKVALSGQKAQTRIAMRSSSVEARAAQLALTAQGRAAAMAGDLQLKLAGINASTQRAIAQRQFQGTLLQSQYAQQSSGGSDWGAIASIAGAVLPFILSDRRLKSDVQRIGTHPSGIGIYAYTIFGRREYGVMADEVSYALPNAVAVHSSGYLAVDYSKL